MLAVFTDDDDASTGKVRAITGWEDAKVADPADDFAALVADAPPETVETVLEAYSHTRVERPDANLLVRARLVAELGLLTTLMVALARKDVGAVEVLTTQLRRLDDAVHPPSEEPDDYRRTSLAPVGPRRRTTQPPALVVDDDEEDLPEVADEVQPDDAAGYRGRGGCGGPDRATDATDPPRARPGRTRTSRRTPTTRPTRSTRDRRGRRAPTSTTPPRMRRRPRTAPPSRRPRRAGPGRRGRAGRRGRPGDHRDRPQGRAAARTAVISSAPGSSGQSVSPVAAWKNAPRTRCSGTPRRRAQASR